MRDAGGLWPATVTVPLLAYDAGTDSGPTDTASDEDVRPRGAIARLTAPPFHGGTPLGSFVFTRLSVAGETHPTASPLTLTVANPAAAVDAFSVAGRLYAGPGGTRALALPVLPAGVYVLRATSGDAEAVRLVTVVR